MKKLKFTRTALKLIVASIALIFCGLAHAQNTETATGTGALASDPTSTTDVNTADGYDALNVNTPKKGMANTAVGYEALSSNTIGHDNMAAGNLALGHNTSGVENTASGAYALYSNTYGGENTANGYGALVLNTSGGANTASGESALEKNTSGGANTASGASALELNTTGSNNTAVGYDALGANTTGTSNIAIGTLAGIYIVDGTDNIEIGALGLRADTKTIRLGKQGTQNKTIIAGIYGETAASGVEVFIGSNGQLGTMTSSAKFKRNIHDMGSVSDALMALRPVTFQYKTDLDPTGTPQFGLIAEEVEKVNPDLVARDADHHIYTVRYEAVNAMLLNEFQKQHATIAEQEKTITDQKTHAADQDKTIAQQQTSLADQQKLLQSLAARVSELEQARH